MVECFAFTNAAWKKPCMVLFSLGSFFCLNASRVIIATVTKTRFTIFDDFYLSLPIVAATAFLPLNYYLNLGVCGGCIMEYALVGGLVAYFTYIVSCITQITTYLDIYCLSIKNKKVE
mmetsp:Transcript_11187/g.18806  ORF Transcript_11187/g.18806 Transcript_11187/m.18806 type:complete len:118 (-) Transcript_11187:65-418(-)